MTNGILFNMSSRIRRVKIGLRYSRDTIRRNDFELDIWNQQFQADFIPMCRLLERYKATGNTNPYVVSSYEIFLFYWHHVFDAFARETAQWRVNNIELLQERIDHIPWVDEAIRDEMQVIEGRINRERTARN